MLAMRKNDIIIVIFIILSTCSVYVQVLDYDFINYDDDVYITENEAQRVFGLTPQKVTIDEKDYNLLQPIEYITNQYENQGDVVVDHATGLMWQKSGSKHYIEYQAALNYVQDMNRQKFADYDDWRLPTIPELMSLLESEQQSNGLYINPIFDKTQELCWSSDKRLSELWSGWWYVGFNEGGYVTSSTFQSEKCYVRGVRP